MLLIQKVASETWENNKQHKYVKFNSVPAKYVQLEVVNGMNGFSSAAEINILRYLFLLILKIIKKRYVSIKAYLFFTNTTFFNRVISCYIVLENGMNGVIPL